MGYQEEVGRVGLEERGGEGDDQLGCAGGL